MVCGGGGSFESLGSLSRHGNLNILDEGLLCATDAFRLRLLDDFSARVAHSRIFQHRTSVLEQWRKRGAVWSNLRRQDLRTIDHDGAQCHVRRERFPILEDVSLHADCSTSRSLRMFVDAQSLRKVKLNVPEKNYSSVRTQHAPRLELFIFLGSCAGSSLLPNSSCTPSHQRQLAASQGSPLAC